MKNQTSKNSKTSRNFLIASVVAGVFFSWASTRALLPKRVRTPRRGFCWKPMAT